MTNVTIRDIRTILTEPDDIRLVIVKIETSEPGLYGVGCATFTQRATAVEAAVNDYLRPFLIGRNVADIEDIWQSSYVSSYWRNGPVLNNALSGVDQALWDIKGKMAVMPVYDLLGGRAREAAPVYVHAAGYTNEEVGDEVQAFAEQGFHHVRIHVDTPGNANYGTGRGLTEADLEYGGAHQGSAQADGSNPSSFESNTLEGPIPVTTWIREEEEGKRYSLPGGIFEPKPYMRSTLSLFEYIRDRFGYGIEIMHDVHERIPPTLGLWFAKEVEKYQLFFLEDLFSPEDNEYFRLVRKQTSTPLSMGELWNSPHEIIPMIQDRLFDFIRIHISQIGGITPAKKIAAMGELYNVRTAWHGPGDTSPVGHAANLMLNLNVHNFGIQEAAIPPPRTREMFPGTPTLKDGMMWSNGKPGLGIDIDEEMAAKFPFKEREYGGAWDTVRRADGGMVKP